MDDDVLVAIAVAAGFAAAFAIWDHAHAMSVAKSTRPTGAPQVYDLGASAGPSVTLGDGTETTDDGTTVPVDVGTSGNTSTSAVA